MRQLLSNDDLKFLVQGVAGVAACGLILGAAMHPNLDIGDRPGGPQMLMGAATHRAGGDETASLTGYAGPAPDYVTGTDWTRAPVAEVAQDAPNGEDADVMAYTSQDELPRLVSRAAWRDEPREPAAYPSDRGGVAYEANRPAPPAPPEAADDTDAG